MFILEPTNHVPWSVVILLALLCLQESNSLLPPFIYGVWPRLLGFYLRDNHFHIMARSSLIELAVITVTFLFSVAALYPLYLRSGRIKSVLQLLLQPQASITLLKCAVDVTLVVLLGLEVSFVVSDGSERSDLAIKLLTRFSLTCVMAAELLCVSQVFRGTGSYFGCGQGCRHSTLVFIFIACFLASVLPVSLRRGLANEGLHFWTAFAANAAGLLSLSFIYCVVMLNLKRTRKESLILSLISGSTTLAAVLGVVVVACILPWTRSFLLGVFLLFVTSLSTIRSIVMEIRLDGRGRRPHGASVASQNILNHDINPGHGRPFTASSSKNPLTRNSQDPAQLYALSILDIYGSGEGIESGSVKQGER